jgi:hypothetical protein
MAKKLGCSRGSEYGTIIPDLVLNQSDLDRKVVRNPTIFCSAHQRVTLRWRHCPGPSLSPPPPPPHRSTPHSPPLLSGILCFYAFLFDSSHRSRKFTRYGSDSVANWLKWSAAELLGSGVKSGAPGQICRQILTDFVQNDSNFWKVCLPPILLSKSR